MSWNDAMIGTARRMCRPLRRTTALSAVCAALLLGGCEGDNLFSDNVGSVTPSGPPLIVSLTVPQSVDEGTVLDVTVRAVAPAGLRRVQVRYRGAVVDDQQFLFQTTVDTVTVNTSIDVPFDAQQTSLTVEAFASDITGRVSTSVIRTVVVNNVSFGAVSVASRDGARRPVRAGGDVRRRDAR